MARHRLTDEQWALIADLFPQPKRTGRSPSDARRMMDGILWVLNTGAPWRDLPSRFGPKSTVWDHFDRWNGDGTLAAVLDRLRGQVEINEAIWCVDGTSVRAAKCAAGGGQKTTRRNPRTTPSAAAAAG
jgi:transposase